MQLVCGARPWALWATHLAWDVGVHYTTTAAAIVLLIVWYDLPQYKGGCWVGGGVQGVGFVRCVGGRRRAQCWGAEWCDRVQREVAE